MEPNKLRKSAAETDFGSTVNYPTKPTLLALRPFSMASKDETEEFVSLRWWRAQSKAIGSKGKLTLDQSIVGQYEWLNIEERDNDCRECASNMRLIPTRTAIEPGVGSRFEWDNRWSMQLAMENFGRTTDGLRRIVGDSTGIYARTMRLSKKRCHLFK